MDPFAGVALGALDAMFHGLHYIGVELEEKFVDLGQQNIDLWNSRYGNGMLPRWGTAVILRGDSRNLVEVLEGARAKGIVASPPWYTPQTHDRGHIMDTGTPAMKRCQHSNAPAGYIPPSTQGNLGNMREGDHEAVVKAVVSSPPFVDAGTHQASNEADERELRLSKERRIGPGGRIGISQTTGYGTSPGQLAAMPEGDVVKTTEYTYTPGSLTLTQFDAKAVAESITFTTMPKQGEVVESEWEEDAMPEGAFEASAVVSSPPWECSDIRKGGSNLAVDKAIRTGRNPNSPSVQACASLNPYGEHPNQLGNTQGDTFWAAARQIVQQCWLALAPGGVAIFVTKRFVRDKKIVEFSQQWADLCESVGFELVEWIRAWLVEDKGTQYNLEGEAVKKEIKRASFFRRLYESKYPENSIDWEDVLCFVKAA